MDTPIKIYCIRHNVTNRAYIGRSSQVDKRLKRHFDALRGHRHIVEDMQADFDEYGENYTVTILDEVYDYDDRLKEYEWMKKYHSNVRGLGYNYKDRYFNRKPKHFVTYKGITKPLAQWAADFNLPYAILYNRAVVSGWDFEKAISTPIKPCETYYKRMKKIREERNSRNEFELIDTIRKHDDPAAAVLIATDIITSFL